MISRSFFDDVVMEFATDKNIFLTSEVKRFWDWWCSGGMFSHSFLNFRGVIIKKCQDARMSLDETDYAVSLIFTNQGETYRD